MIYAQLTQEFIDDAIAANMYHREVEHFQYQLNIDTYQATVDVLPDGDPYKAKLQASIANEVAQQAIGEKAYQALESLIKDQAAHDAAIARVKAKRDTLEAAALIAP